MGRLVIATLTAVLIGSTFVGCGSSKPNSVVEVSNVATDITNNILDRVELRETAPVDDALAKDVFHLNLDDVEEYSIEQGMINTGLETIAVVKAKDGKVDSVKSSLEKVIEDKKSVAFYPGEPEAVEDARLEVIGNYVGLIIIPEYYENQKNNDKALEIFKESLGK